MKKQSCKKRQETELSSLCKLRKKKKQATRQNCPKSSAGHKHSQNKSQLPVTCGHKEGILHLKKYNNIFLTLEQKCIFSEGQWFKPTEFERFGMKDRNKKWRTSILCKGIPLQKLIEDGFLLSKSFQKSKVQDAQKKKSPVCLEQQESDEKINDSQDIDDDNDEDDAIDMSVFEGPTLPVTCGSDSGILHKCRFAKGHCGRCIRTENFWLSPEDFIKLNKRDGTWRKDIVSHGMPLGKLITKGILEPHAVNCDCEICQELDQYLQNDDVCFVCNSEGDLVCCDECPRAFHSHCHLPAADGDSLGKWSCTFCVMKNREDSSQKTQQEVLSSPVSQYTLHCQCLLLHLLRENMTDPCTNVPGHSENLCGPMMLGRVKLNLENNDYQTVQEFVSDIEYVFHHYTSKRDSDFSRMTSRLKEMFETIFKLI
ncbi:nuclear body protein SP140-like protein isoform X3 [Megalobrama amblycephala]|uniref:nuclear body protein SP140-like protein isoform X3 n=1 Tax=Megalobrama amblycephala TaxID=75352 RepID=UPI002014662A|nr:nuclear body protein SP140-like protein isoform X3 [Megalobrama amblycephala]